MTAILVDRETGDIVLDDNNNTIKIDNKTAFEQIINGVFHCQRGSERFNLEYGFDLEKAIKESSVENSEMFIESLVVQALNKNVEKLIKELKYVKAIKNGRDMNVTINVESILGDQLSLETELV